MDASKKSAKLTTLLLGVLTVGIIGFVGYVYHTSRVTQAAIQKIPTQSASPTVNTAPGDAMMSDAQRKAKKGDFVGAMEDAKLAADFFKGMKTPKAKKSAAMYKEYGLKAAGRFLEQARVKLSHNERNQAIGLAEQSMALYKQFGLMDKAHEAKALASHAGRIDKPGDDAPAEQTQVPPEQVEMPSMGDGNPNAPTGSRGHGSSRPNSPAANNIQPEPAAPSRPQQPQINWKPKNDSSSARLGDQGTLKSYNTGR